MGDCTALVQSSAAPAASAEVEGAMDEGIGGIDVRFRVSMISLWQWSLCNGKLLLLLLLNCSSTVEQGRRSATGKKRLRLCLGLALTKERNQKSKELKSAIKVAAAAADRCAAFGLCLSTVLKGLYQTRDDYFI